MKMLELLEKILDRLITVKSIVTIILTVVFAVLVTRGTEVPQIFTTIFMSVISFYFGIQSAKQEE